MMIRHAPKSQRITGESYFLQLVVVGSTRKNYYSERGVDSDADGAEVEIS